MKFLCILLSIYVLLLSAMPCCVEESLADEAEHVEASCKEKKSDDCSTCSQFVTCGSCGFTPVDPDAFKIYFSFETIPIVLPLPSLNDFIVRIWQPPQFGYSVA